MKHTHVKTLDHVLPLALLLAIPTLAGADVFVREFSETFETQPGQSLEVRLDSGNVEVSSSPGNQLSVHVVLKAKARNEEKAEKAFSRMNVEIVEDSGDFRVVARQKTNIRSVFGLIRPQMPKAQVTVVCPPQFDLKIDTGSGNIQVKDITGHLSFDTGSGNIIGQQLAGDIIADTGSGNIRLVAVDGTVTGDTGSGGIRVDGLNGTFSGDTGSGGIEVAGVLSQFEADTGSGTISINSFAAPTEKCAASTGSGSISVSLPDTAAFNLRASTGSGGISVGFENASSVTAEKNRYEASINNGGPHIVLSTGSGSISVQPN